VLGDLGTEEGFLNNILSPKKGGHILGPLWVKSFFPRKEGRACKSPKKGGGRVKGAPG